MFTALDTFLKFQFCIVNRSFHWSSWSWSTRSLKVNVIWWECTTYSSQTSALFVSSRRNLENTSSNGNGLHNFLWCSVLFCHSLPVIFLVIQELCCVLYYTYLGV